MNNTLRVTGPIIKSLQATSSTGALVETPTGLEVVHHLGTADLADDVVVLRAYAREWADDLVAIARLAAEEDGTSTHLSTLRAAAGRLATDELLEERAREERVVATPRRLPARLPRQPRQHRPGRHAAPMTPDLELLEAEALLDLLEALDLEVAA